MGTAGMSDSVAETRWSVGRGWWRISLSFPEGSILFNQVTCSQLANTNTITLKIWSVDRRILYAQ